MTSDDVVNNAENLLDTIIANRVSGLGYASLT